MHGSPVKKRVVERTLSADCQKLEDGRNCDCTSGSQQKGDVDGQKSPPAIPRQVMTRFHRSGSVKFPKLEDCAHFHYDFVSIGNMQASLYEDDASQDNSHGAQQTADDDHFDSIPFCLQVSSAANHAPWIIQRTIASLKTLDRQLHRCVYDRKYSLLPCIGRDFCNHHCGSLSPDLKHALKLYFNRLSSIAGNMINCGAVLNWFEMDNRGNRIIVSDTDSAINTPAIGAAHVVNSYVAKAPDELSLEVGNIVSIIDMPPAHESSWWRGKNRFEVGFFPSSCVEVIGGSSVTCVASKLAPAQVKPVLRKRGKLIVRLRAFFSSRPERIRLKRSGIVKERVFGCDLGEHLLNSGNDVPIVLKYCSELIEMYGVVDGIYRLSGISSNIQRLRTEFDDDRTPPLNDDIHVRDIHCVSSLLKLYFRELPNPLLTYQLYDKFVAAVQDDDDRKVIRMHDVIQQLPPPHHRTCAFLMRHLSRMASLNEKTGMTCKNLAIVWAPNLLRCKDLEQQECSLAALKNVGVQAVVTEFLISHADILFNDDFMDRRREHAAGRKTARPKSLAISTPTKLLSLEEARQRAVAACSAERQQVYLDVGGGPASLPPVYHTVIDLPKGKKWNKIKKSSLSSKFKGMPHDGRLSSDNLIKLKESSTSMELFSRDLMRQRSDLTCAGQDITVAKLPFVTEHPTVLKAMSVPAAESNRQTFELADLLYPLASEAALTPDCTSSHSDRLVPLPVSSSVISPGSDSSCSKPVDGDPHMKPDAAVSRVDSHLSDYEAAHSADHNTGHVSSSSDEVFLSSCSHNLPSSTLVEPLSSVRCAAVPQHDEQDTSLVSNATGPGGAFELGQMEANKASEMSPLQQLKCSLFDDIFCPSSASESESEPLGGGKDALLNPDHCISDLCLEDNDDDSIFGASGFQSPRATDSLGNHNNSMAASPIVFRAGHGLALTVINSRFKHECTNLVDMSKLDVSSFSHSRGYKPHKELGCSSALSFDETQMNSSIGSVTDNSRFRSPPKSPVCDETSVYCCASPLNSSSPFRSPPMSRAIVVEAICRSNAAAPAEDLHMTETLPFHSAVTLASASATSSATDVVNTERTTRYISSPDIACNTRLAEFAESPTESAELIRCDENSLNGVAEKDMTVLDDAMLECDISPVVSRCDMYTPNGTSESSVAAVGRNCSESPVNEMIECDSPVMSRCECDGASERSVAVGISAVNQINDVECNRSETDVEIKCENESFSPCCDVYSTDRESRQTSVKQLKCKFESQQDEMSQVGARRSPVASTAESNASNKLQRDVIHSVYPYTKKLEDISCPEISDIGFTNFPNSNGVRDSHTEHNSECGSSVPKTATVPVRDFKQQQQPSVSVRISCFEPVMSVSSAGCQKENKRARLSSCGSAELDGAETKSNSMSHSTKEPFDRSTRQEANDWFVQSPERGRAKRYQRCVSAGHEDLLALLNIPAASAKNIPRVSERKRMFETETAVPKVNSSDSVSLVACRSPAFECSQYSCGPQRPSSLDKENSVHGYESNCKGRVNSRRSLFEGSFARSDSSTDSDLSVEADCHSFNYPVNRIKTKNRLHTAVPLEVSASSVGRFK